MSVVDEITYHIRQSGMKDKAVIERGALEHWRQQFAQLEAQLAAHLENEGDECPLCVCEAALELIADIGADYDGYTTSNQGLRELIDELVDYARNPEKATGYRTIT